MNVNTGNSACRRAARRPTLDAPRASVRAGGFSLLEMLVVLIIIGLLAALVAPRLVEHLGRSKAKTTRAQIEMLAGAIEQFKLDMGRPPSADEGLVALLIRPQSPDADKWTGPYLSKNFVPKDGWDRQFEYLFDEHNRFVIRSLGADGKPGGRGEDVDLDNRNT